MDVADAIPTLETVTADDIEAFHREREKILASVRDRLARDVELDVATRDLPSARIAAECAKIFAENLYVSVKYGLPGALHDYLAWLRPYLAAHALPPSFIAKMLSAFQCAALAFVAEPSNETVSAALRGLRQADNSLTREAGA